MRNSMFFPLRLQFFSDPDTGSNGQGSNGDGQQNQQSQQSQQATSFDYDKLASIINGKQTVTEDTILKNYFKQQGLSQEEAAQAIQTFKTEKAKNQPDVTVIQTQLAQAQALADKAEIERLATVEAIGLGIDVKTLPYVLKMADLNSVKGQDGKVDQESIKKALSKVLEDIPQLKPSKENSNGGFQIGGTGGQGNTNANEDALRGIFGIKK